MKKIRIVDGDDESDGCYKVRSALLGTKSV